MSGIVGGAGSRSGIIGQTEIDYEEGTFGGTAANSIVFPATSGTVTCGSHGILSYTKIGRAVHITGEVVVSATSSPVGAIRIHLPFAVGDGINLSLRGATAFGAYGVSYGSGSYALVNWNEGDAICNLFSLGDGLTWGDVTLSNNDELLFAFTYFI